MLKKSFLILLLFLIVIPNLNAVTPFLGIGLEMALPLRDSVIGESIALGLTTKFRLNKNMGVLFDFFWVNTKYYNFDGAWYGPDSFSNIDAESSDWIFYHNEFLFNLNFLVTFPLSKLMPYIATGPAFLLLAPSEAAEYYPDFAATFDSYDDSVKAFLGYMVKTGVEYFIIPNCAVAGEFFFLVPRILNFFEDVAEIGPIYFRNATHFAISVSFWM